MRWITLAPSCQHECTVLRKDCVAARALATPAEGCAFSYRYDPYGPVGRVHVADLSGSETSSETGAEKAVPQPEFVHDALLGVVPFYPFPHLQFDEGTASVYDVRSAHGSAIPPLPEDGSDFLFVGQVPYSIRPRLFATLCEIFAGIAPLRVEVLVKKNARFGNRRMRSGCLHVFCEPGTGRALIEALDGRVLFDRHGMWWGSQERHRDAIEQHLASVTESETAASTPRRAISVAWATSEHHARTLTKPRPTKDRKNVSATSQTD